ncbi:hypothetical protein ACIXWY_23410 [Bacteroides fragilis]
MRERQGNRRGLNGIPNPGTARWGPKGHLRFGKAAGQIHEPVSGAVLDDRMTLYLCMGKSHRQGSTAGSDKRENE